MLSTSVVVGIQALGAHEVSKGRGCRYVLLLVLLEQSIQELGSDVLRTPVVRLLPNMPKRGQGMHPNDGR
jgi:hypothetical protein